MLLNNALISGGLLGASGGSSSSLSSNLAKVSQKVLSQSYTPTFTPEEAETLANSVDSLALQSILQATDYTANTSLFNSLSSTSLYDSTVSLLASQYSVDTMV
ncbi:MAG: hypothetical protein OXR68_06010 [Alphaproteobacteria bacterium]|nr:hypothetical protein [Alphaproteobacteria bacterium]MDD9920159.1 hypothetical protein [Alphaproteobacteria bacterium]